MAPTLQTINQLTVVIYEREAMDFDEHRPYWLGYSETVVSIRHEDGRAWELRLDDELESVVEFTMHGRVTRKALDAVPFETLRDVAVAHLKAHEAGLESGFSTEAARLMAHAEPGEAQGSTPTTREFSVTFNRTPERVEDPETGELVPRRQHLADRYRVSVYAVDKWIRAGRDRGLIPPPPGKRRGPKTTKTK